MPTKNGYTRPGYRACAKMVTQDATKALSIARQVKNMLNTELHIINTNDTDATVPNTATLVLLNGSSQGDSTAQHQGNQFRLKSVNLNYSLCIHASATDTLVRVMVILDRRPDGAVFTLAELLVDSTAGDNVISPYHHDYKRRFRVLYDRKHSLGSNNKGKALGKAYKALNNIQRFTGTGATISSIEAPSIYLVFLSDEATNTPTITYYSQVRFIDN